MASNSEPVNFFHSTSRPYNPSASDPLMKVHKTCWKHE